ncbi:hypothetical protein KCP69_17010 [Salmonella enterica subsp. enterica]|nr:hypothetical protein KCP69_17010 [Salmonella enterica subsp. enterica]
MLRAEVFVDCWGRKNNLDGKPSPLTVPVKWWRQRKFNWFPLGAKANGTSNSATGLPVQKPNCSSAFCWAAVMRLLTGFPYFGGEGSEYFNHAWRWITSCCTNCRLNVRNWPMVPTALVTTV